ncbi:sulfurtransferase [Polaribacter sp. Z014]|uniref:sulfurtransferase n=1 Tax=Polaribacter sp. Z014 TaxID=2927126 RepID=UPI0020211393|nr:sulfurtransferase [Polaribacter sp. Z014]MCL7762796.1 sulfurtransferase [Polaribacter sp. Z014]
MMSLKITKPIVSVDWLQANLDHKNLIILDCTIPKVTEKSSTSNPDEKYHIKGALFFDIKYTFSEVTAPFPNTILDSKLFEERAQKLGVNNESIIVCYDDLGIYSSPRVWWMFQLMGFTNVAVLDGGFPKWKEQQYSIEKQQINILKNGDFKVNYQPKKIKFTVNVLEALNNEAILITDARSKGRFNSSEPEPRSDVKGGHIPNSVSLPFSEIIENGSFKSEAALKVIFNQINPEDKAFIFSCGTGITAAVLALGAEISGFKNYAVYDGSWTEWGSTENLPIEI